MREDIAKKSTARKKKTTPVKTASASTKAPRKSITPPERKPFDRMRIKVARSHIMWSISALAVAFLAMALINNAVSNSNSAGEAANINAEDGNATRNDFEQGQNIQNFNGEPIDPTITDNQGENDGSSNEDKGNKDETPVISSNHFDSPLESGDHSVVVTSITPMTTEDSEDGTMPTLEEGQEYVAVLFRVTNKSDATFEYVAEHFRLSTDKEKTFISPSADIEGQFESLTLKAQAASTQQTIIFIIDTREGVLEWLPVEDENVGPARLIFTPTLVEAEITE